MRKSKLRRNLDISGWREDKDGYWRHVRYRWFFRIGWLYVELWKQQPDEEPVYYGRNFFWNMTIKRNPSNRTVGFILGKFIGPDGSKHACYIWHRPKGK
jgi:hypothetical protein